MELIEGLPLSAVLRRRAGASQPIPLETIACIGIALCEALAYAHKLAGTDGVPLHIVHRDVSPQNVMLSRAGGVKLIDFGVARARTRETKTQVGLVRGKLAYAAPEQLRGEELDGRTDLFALGVVLYEMVTLERPFAGASEPAICAAILEGRRRPVGEVRSDAGEIAVIIDRALSLDRASRYPDAAALARALDEAFPGARSKI
jgi:serine/threonine-protein kinase